MIATLSQETISVFFQIPNKVVPLYGHCLDLDCDLFEEATGEGHFSADSPMSQSHFAESVDKRLPTIVE